MKNNMKTKKTVGKSPTVLISEIISFSEKFLFLEMNYSFSEKFLFSGEKQLFHHLLCLSVSILHNEDFP